MRATRHDMNIAAIFAGRARQELPRGAASSACGPGIAMHVSDRGAHDVVMRAAITTNVLSAKGQAMFGMSVRAVLRPAENADDAALLAHRRT